MMKFYKEDNYTKASRKAANIISAQIVMKPNSVLGLATGSSPIGTYEFLVDWYKKGDLDFSEISTVNLDEYQGLDGENDQSYRYFMNQHLFNHVNINKDNTYVPNGNGDEAQECARYDATIESLGGVDLQLLGMGHNGHIGFNEPGDVFAKGTHCVALAQTTIEANARLFSDISEVPTHAFTMGIKTIMSAKKILVIISGKEKAEMVKQAFLGPITPMVPASILQLHNDVTIIGDADALSELDI